MGATDAQAVLAEAFEGEMTDSRQFYAIVSRACRQQCCPRIEIPVWQVATSRCRYMTPVEYPTPEYWCVASRIALDPD